MNKNLIYIVEDEPAIAQTVLYTLEAEGFTPVHHNTGASCLTALAREKPALILLDVGLADGSGFDFFRQIKSLTDTPVIYMTARGDEIDRVVGLEMGAEDYIVKPFSLRELVARVRVVLRRYETTSQSATAVKPVLKTPTDTSTNTHTSAFHIDHPRKQIHFHNKLLSLTLHEYRILETFIAHPQQVFSRDQLLDKAWDAPDHRLERTIDSHIKSLRNKLREVSSDTSPIITHRGMGYSLDADA